MMPASMYENYKSWVKNHAGTVQNVERVLHWLVWNPERFSSSEYAYEGFNAAIGLLGIWHETIITEHEHHKAPSTAFWLAALEQVQTLVELRAIQLEQHGKLNRYGPLAVMEMVKAFMRLRIWRQTETRLAQEAVSPDDVEERLHKQQLQALVAAMDRVRQTFTAPAAAAGDAWAAAAAAATASHKASSAAFVHDDMPPGFPAAPDATAAAAPAVAGASVAGNDSCAAASVGSLAPTLPGGATAGATAAVATCSSKQPAAVEQAAPQQGLPVSRSFQISRSLTAEVSALYQPEALQELGNMLPRALSSANGGLDALTSSSQTPWMSRRQTACRPSGAGDDAATAATAAAAGSSACGGGKDNSKPGGDTNAAAASARRRLQQQYETRLLRWERSAGVKMIWTAEMLRILRPVLYVTLLKRLGCSSWRPWISSLVVDLASNSLLHKGHGLLQRGSSPEGPTHTSLYSLALLRSLSSAAWSASEQQELLQRKVQLLRYFLRSPFFDGVTRPALLRLSGCSSWVPGMGAVMDFVYNLVASMQRYYTYVEST